MRAVWRLLRWLVVTEIGVWRSLFLWVTRRVPGDGPGVERFSYARDVTPLIAAFIFVSLIELPVVHLLIPWDTARLALLIVSVWGVLWMVGYLAGVRVFPHLLDDQGIRIRYGTSADIRIPWEAVAGVSAQRRNLEHGRHVSVTGGVVSVAVTKMTKVDVALHGPTMLELPDGPEEVAEVRLYVDEPRSFVVSANRRREAGRGTDPRNLAAAIR
jgi:Bacterial PH domain